MNRRAFIAGIIGAGLAAKLLPEAGTGWRKVIPWETRTVTVGIARMPPITGPTFVVEGTDHLGRYAKDVIQLTGAYPAGGIETTTKWRHVARAEWVLLPIAAQTGREKG